MPKVSKARAHYRKLAKDHRERQKAWLDSLRDKPCLRCKNKFPVVCMDWHHRNPKTKSFSIRSQLTRSKKSILKEIAKCDLVCANCHRIIGSESKRNVRSQC